MGGIVTISRILIANRGEIAHRIHRSAKEIGIHTVGVFSDDDKAGRYLDFVDTAIGLGGLGPKAYLDQEKIIKIAEDNKCDAIHPGYGFLSENAEFAEKVIEVGKIFIGPSVDQLSLFGDKLAALAYAKELGIPVLETSGTLKNSEELTDFVQQNTGINVIIKAAGGGGGRGMRVVLDPSDCSQLFNQAKTEADNAFGDDRLYAEQFIKEARHIEVQIVGDGKGGVNHLWERDCSLQRRHQKLIEFAPAPGLDIRIRDDLLNASLKMASSVGYKGLGTFEFLVDTESDSFYFIEANARLQVEHTVTEQICGLDLVKLQIQIANGQELSDLGLSETPLAQGCAVQFRINAEKIDSMGNVIPKGGVLSHYEVPTGPGIRIDASAYPGYETPISFDSLLAKLVISVPNLDFDQLLSRARRAMDEFKIEGVENNLDLLMVLSQEEKLAKGRINTTYLDQNASKLVRELIKLPSRKVIMPDEGLSPHVEAKMQELGKDQKGISAPMRASVVEINVTEGQSIVQGDQVALLEAMKMHHEIRSPYSGNIEAVLVGEGDVIEELGVICVVMPTGDAQDSIEEQAPVKLEAERADLSEVIASHQLGLDENRPEAIAKRRKIGGRTARENVGDLCDDGSFMEYGALAIAAQRRRRSIDDLKQNTPADGMIAGFGTVNANYFGKHDSRCAILAYDYTVLAGTQGVINHKKKDRVFELVKDWGTPVVFFTEGGGGRPGDVDAEELNNAWLDLETFTTWPQINGIAPRIAINSGRCFAGNAVIFGCADITIATKNSNIGLAGPAMIEHGGLGKYKPEDIGPISVQARNGVVDLVCEDEREATSVAREVLGFFQGNKAKWSCSDQRVMRHLVPENRLRAYDMRKVIMNLADDGSVVEMRKDYGVGLYTALIRVEGHAFGLIANNPLHLGGAIDGDAGEKGGRFLQLCDSFGIPVVSLCDTPGFMVGPESEKTAAVRRGARLIVVSANLSVPLFTIVVRKGYGLGAQAMAGGGFHEPFFTIAWPTAEMGPMGLEGAVELGFRKELESTHSTEERNALFHKLVGQMYDKGKAISVAGSFEIDAVIDPKETRDWLQKGLIAAKKTKKRHKNYRFVDVW